MTEDCYHSLYALSVTTVTSPMKRFCMTGIYPKVTKTLCVYVLYFVLYSEFQ